MISFEKKCIFVHIPKTGGTSIEDAIWGSDWSQRTTEQLWMGAIRPGYNKYQSGGLQHLLATQIRQEVGEERFATYYKFTFVRNPWDRVVSQFHYIKTRPMIMKMMGLWRFSSFKKYIDAISARHDAHVQSFEQWRFVYDDSSKLLVDFVGRFERLQEDFAQVARRLGLACDRLPHSMKSQKRKPYPKYYNRRLVQRVAEIYARDIELFGYEFGDDV